MTRFRSTAVLLATLALASGCGILGAKTEEQQRVARAREKPLEVPPDLTTPTPDDRFAVPDPRASTSFSQYNRDRASEPRGTQAPTAAVPAVLPLEANAHIERAGSQRWIVVKAEPAQVWPIVREFWLDLGFSIARETPEAGILETNWKDTRANVETTGIRGVISRALPGMYSSGERDRFRTRLERGAAPGTTEVYVSHRGLEEVYTSATQESTRWVPRGTGTDRDLEAEMLGRLLVKLGEAGKNAAPLKAVAPGAAAIATASGASAAGFVALEGNGAGPLVVKGGFDQVWAQVAVALERAGITVVDRDRSKGFYVVRPGDPNAPEAAAKESFLDRLAFWRSWTRTKEPRYRVQVTESGAGQSRIVVQNAKGEADASAAAKQVLSRLSEQLQVVAPTAAPATIASTAFAAANAVLENNGAGPLVVNDTFERAWRRVGLALDRVGFTVEDRDRSKGVFFVRYIDPDAPAAGENKGWLDTLAFWRSSSKKAEPQYRVQVAESGAGQSRILVQNAKGETESSATAKRILALLFEQLK